MHVMVENMPNMTEVASIFNDQGNAMLKQSLAEKDVILKGLLSNAYLRAILSLIDYHRSMGYGGVDVVDHRVEKFMGGEVEWQMPNERLKVIPYLQALGYAVLHFNDNSDCPFTVDWEYSPTYEEFSRWKSRGWAYYPAQDFEFLKTTGAFDHSTMSENAYYVDDHGSDDDL